MLSLILIFTTLFSFADFDWQAHRGGRGLYPENTINAMKNSLKFPINTLELDVVISKDHQVVVSHEPWMNEEMCLDPKGKEVSGKKVNLYQLTYKEIAAYDCGTKTHPRFPRQFKVKEHKPLLKDLIVAMESANKNFNIEIKSTVEDEKEGHQPEYKKFTDEVMSVILKHLQVNRFSIQSFDWRVIKYLHEKYPQVVLVALRETTYSHKTVFDELGFLPDIFSPDFEMLTAADVAYFHEKNVKVIPWTVNSPDEMNRVIAMHVDGIITDYPDLIAQIPASSYLKIKPCSVDHNRFEGKCVQIPRHGVASEQNPGWDCKSGYEQIRNTCVKIKLPRHAKFNEDGKTWLCKAGYERYRFTCRKIK